MTKSSGEACGPSGPVSIAGASEISRASSPLKPLVISVSLPERSTITVCGSPVPFIAALEALGDRQHRREDDDDAGDTDDRRRLDEPSRCGIERSVTPVTARICDSQFI